MSAAGIIFYADCGLSPASPVRSAVEGIAHSPLFHAAGDAMFLSSDVLLDCNAHALAVFRATQGEMLGRSLDDFYPETQPDGRDSRQAAREYSARAAEGETLSFDWLWRRVDHTVFEASVTLTYLRFGDQNIHFWILRDNSHLIDLKAQLAACSEQLE